MGFVLGWDPAPVSKPKIFLSAVSGQFRSCREKLASDLRTIGAEVVEQADFRQEGWTLLRELQDRVAGCDRVIALVGDAYGFEPPEAARPDGKRFSYTQWEYHFASGQRLDGSRPPAKPIFVYLATPDYLENHPIEQEAEQADLQQQFRAAIQGSGKRYEKFGSEDELRWKILRDVARVDGPAVDPSDPTSFPTVVIGLSRRADVYVFRAAIRWWRGKPIEIGQTTEIPPDDGQLLTQRVESALRVATEIFSERDPILPLVVELVLSQDLLLEPFGRWRDRWMVAGLSASPEVRRLMHTYYPVRLRFDKHWESGPIALKLRSRLEPLKGCLGQLFQVIQDLKDLDDRFENPSATPWWAIIQDEKAPEREWWRYESVVCAAFTRRPQLERHLAMKKISARRSEARPHPFLNAIDYGVPFVVWPNKKPADKQALAEHLAICRRPARLCHHFYERDPESFCVLDESCGSPWPSESRLVSEVALQPGD
jgi:hypothetical protein